MKKMERMKKLLSLFLCAVLLLSCLPVGALAAEGDACAVTEGCTGVYENGACTVCGEAAPTGDAGDVPPAPPADGNGEDDAPAPEHTHVYDGEAIYGQKDETVHTVTRACTTCEDAPTQTVEENHAYADGTCPCGKAEPTNDQPATPPADGEKPADGDVGDGSPVPPTPVDEAVEAVKAQLEALPTVEALSSMTHEEKISLHNGAYLTADHDYNALTEEQKAQVDASKLMALADYFTDPSNLQTVETHEHNNISWNAITSLGPDVYTGNYYLQSDIICSSNLTIKGTVNLCLNGYKLIWNGSQRKITIDSNATLNIYDCGETGTCSLVMENNGELNIHGGTYGGKYINGGTNYNQLIDNKGTLHIYNAKVEADIEAINNTGTLIIDDGSFEVASTWTVYCIDNAGGTAEINGGSFTSSSSYTIYNNGNSSAKLTIDGGTFSNKATDSAAVYVTQGICEIKNGTFSATGKRTILTNSSGVCKISGGNFSSSSGMNILERFYEGGIIEISGGTFETEGGGLAKIDATNGRVSGGLFKNGINMSDLQAKLAEGYNYYKNGEIVINHSSVVIPGGDVEVKKTYTVTVTTDGNGTASASHTSTAEGTEVTLTATPNEGYQFQDWQVISGGVSVKDDKFTVGTSNVEIKAIFKEIPAAAKHKHALGNTGGEITWTPITSLSDINASGNYYLADDITESDTPWNVSQNINLCLNGKTLTTKYVDVAKDKILNICDCSDEKTGTITAGSSSYTISNSGTVHLYSGTVRYTATSSAKAAIYNKSGAQLNISGGIVTSTTCDAYAIRNNGTLEITGGTFQSAQSCVYHEGGTADISGSPSFTSTGTYAVIDIRADMTITGGNFKHTGEHAVIYTTSGTPTVTINGGSFESTGNVVQCNYGTVEIQNGTFTATGSGKDVLVANAVIKISGGEFKSGGDKACIRRGVDGRFQLSGGTFTGGLRLNLENPSAGGPVLPESLVDGYAYYQNDNVYEFGPGVNTQIIDGGTVTVEKAPVISVAGITINPSTLSLVVGGSQKLTATVTPENASNKEVTWSSGNAAVATVAQDGTVIAVAPGEATITATAKDGSGVTADCAVTVGYLDAPELSFIIEDADYVDGDVHWFMGGNAATVKVPSDYTISATQGGPYAESVSITTPTVYLKDKNDAQTDAIDLSSILKWDTTPPTGILTLKGTDHKWDSLTSNAATLYTQKKEITVAKADNESGVKSVVYSVKSEPVSDWETIDDWKACGETIELTENVQSVVYVKLTDNVGNESCLSTDILCVDTVAPQFQNVKDGDVFYTTQTVTATDDNDITMHLNGDEFDGTIPGNPDEDTKYTITATDQAGNMTSVKITMKPIASLAEDLPTKDKVMPDDKQAIETVLNKVESLLPEDSIDNPTEETEALNDIKDTCTELLEVIDDAETVIELIEALPDASKVEPENADVIKAYEAALDAYEDEDLPAESKRIVDEICKVKLDAVGKALTDYDIIKGHKSSYVKGSYKKLSFTANGYFGKFTGVEVDGKLIDEKYYTAESGSTIITLKSSYLETLKTGKHTIQVNYTDGNTGGEEYFRITVNNGSPFTGDDSHMMLFGGMALTSLLGMVMMIVFFPRKKGKYQR